MSIGFQRLTAAELATVTPARGVIVLVTSSTNGPIVDIVAGDGSTLGGGLSVATLATGGMTGAQIVTAIDTELGSDAWQSQLDAEDIAGLLDAYLGSADWRTGGGGTWGSIGGDIENQSDLQAALVGLQNDIDTKLARNGGVVQRLDYTLPTAATMATDGDIDLSSFTGSVGKVLLQASISSASALIPPPLPASGNGRTVDLLFVQDGTGGRAVDDAVWTANSGVELESGTLVPVLDTGANGQTWVSLRADDLGWTLLGRPVLPAAQIKTVRAQIAFAARAVDVATGIAVDGITIPPELAGRNLVRASARSGTAGATGSTTIQIHRDRAGTVVDCLTNVLTLGDGAFTATSAAADVNTANDDCAAGDLFYPEVTAVHSGTAPKGLWITLEFE